MTWAVYRDVNSLDPIFAFDYPENTADSLTDQAVVMRRGRVVECGPTPCVLDDPQHDYTRLLRACVPRPGWRPSRRDAATGPG